jgi:phospholipid/cholesterol/gamma-HCH transport system ATP-binding protein
VTHDVGATLRIVDHIYIVAEGRIVAEGTPEQIRASDEPLVHQFVHGEADGPVGFHYPAAGLAESFGVERRP